jgi:hypothetical protein
MALMSQVYNHPNLNFHHGRVKKNSKSTTPPIIKSSISSTNLQASQNGRGLPLRILRRLISGDA